MNATVRIINKEFELNVLNDEYMRAATLCQRINHIIILLYLSYD
jgi:hypothetical protein